MKIKITLTQDEVTELVAQHIATLMELPIYARHVKRAPYSWEGYVVEIDEEAERKEAEAALLPTVTDEVLAPVIAEVE